MSKIFKINLLDSFDFDELLLKGVFLFILQRLSDESGSPTTTSKSRCCGRIGDLVDRRLDEGIDPSSKPVLREVEGMFPLSRSIEI